VFDCDVLVAGAHRARQAQRRQAVEFRGAQADAAVGQHQLHPRAVAPDGRVTQLQVGCLDDLERLGQPGTAGPGHRDQDQQ
jgi:hypothetical protein